jgi:hypothetical protein
LSEGATVDGNGAVAWDGREGDSRMVASGIYFCRVKAGGFAQTRKIVLLD